MCGDRRMRGNMWKKMDSKGQGGEGETKKKGSGDRML